MDASEGFYETFVSAPYDFYSFTTVYLEVCILYRFDIPFFFFFWNFAFKVKEWLQNLGIGDHTTVVQDDDDADDDPVPLHHEESISAKNRWLQMTSLSLCFFF